MITRFLIAVAICFAFQLLVVQTVSAQAEWIRRMDSNGNGYLEPDEISDRARPYIQRFANRYDIRLNRANPISRLEDAARRYYEQRTDESQNIDPRSASRIKGFGPDPEQALIPGFGIGTVRYPYSLEDVEQAESTFERSDRNRDGFIDSEEAEQARWTESDPFTMDANRDGRLSRMELIQRYARRRALEENRERIESMNATPGNLSQEDEEQLRRDREREYWRARMADRGSRELATNIVERYDFNRDNLLQPAELVSAGFEAGKADYNRDGDVSRDELTRWLSDEMDAVGDRMSDALPTWFFEKDLNNDRQIEMFEFSEEWTASESAEFAGFDTNADGIITMPELLSAQSIVGGQFANQKAKVLLPRDAVISEIEVEEDYMIGDLNVQISITHTFTEHLDGYLVGPDGKQIELFTGVGGSDDHFDRTVFDDEAGENIARSRPPFRGNFQPESLMKREPGLSHFKGKNLKGIWQLIVRSSRSDRSGVLHNWSLIVKPAAPVEYSESTTEE